MKNYPILKFTGGSSPSFSGATFLGYGIDGVTYMKLAGAYQVLGRDKFTLGIIYDIVRYGKAYGPAPYHGESVYSGRWIQNGIDAIE